MQCTACCTKREYAGQLVERPEVITEGAAIEECREMLADADRRRCVQGKRARLSPTEALDALFERISVNAG